MKNIESHYSGSGLRLLLVGVFILTSINGNFVFAQNIPSARLVYDIDGDGKTQPLTDGLLSIRYLFGFRGDALITQVHNSAATRTSANQLEAYLAAHLSDMDIDGNGKTEALSDGLLLLRSLFGFKGNALTAGAIGEHATRTEATEIIAFINGAESCPAFFVNTTAAKRCTHLGLATYSFQGGQTGFGTISLQQYSGLNCTGFKSGLPINDTLTYSLQNINIASDCSASANMTVNTSSYGSRSRNVIIKNGIVSF